MYLYFLKLCTMTPRVVCSWFWEIKTLCPYFIFKGLVCSLLGVNEGMNVHPSGSNFFQEAKYKCSARSMVKVTTIRQQTRSCHKIGFGVSLDSGPCTIKYPNLSEHLGYLGLLNEVVLIHFGVACQRRIFCKFGTTNQSFFHNFLRPVLKGFF
jgi:hypothetical protein